MLPNTTQFLRDLRTFLERVERTAELKVPVKLDTARLRADLQAAARDISVLVDADMRLVYNELARLRVELRGFGRANPINLRIDVDTAAFRARMALLLRDQTVTVNTQVRGDGVASLTRLLGLGGGRGAFSGLTSGLGSIASVGSKASLGIAGVSAALSAAVSVTGGMVLALGQVAQSFALLPALGLAGAAGLGVLALAFTGLEDAGGAAGQVRDAVKGLAPAFQDLRSSVQSSFFADLAGPIRDLADQYLPALTTGLSGIATTFNGGLRGVLDTLSQPLSLADTSTGLENTRLAFENITAALAPLTAAFRDVAVVGSGFFPALTAGAGEAATRFAEFIAQARETGQLQEFISTGLSAIGDLATAAVHLGGAFGALFTAADASGGGFLNSLVAISTALNTLLSSSGAQAGLSAFFSGTAAALGTLLSSLGAALPGILAALGPLFATITTQVAGVLGSLVTAIAPVIVSLAGPLQQLFQILGPVIADTITAIAPLLGSLASSLGPVIAQIATTLAPIITALGPVLATLASTAVTVFAELASALLPVLGTVLLALLPAIQQIVAAAAPLAVILAQGIGQALIALAPVVAQLVTALAPFIAQLLTQLQPTITALMPILAQLASTFALLLLNLLTSIQPLLPLLTDLVVAVLPLLPSILGLAVDALAALVPLLTDSHSNFGLIVQALTLLLPYITQFVAYSIQMQVMITDLIATGIRWIGNLDNIRGVVEQVGAKVREVFDAIAAKVTSAVASVVATAGRVIAFKDTVVGAFGELASAAATKLTELVSTFLGLPGRIISAIGNLSSDFRSVGSNIVQGIIDGITGGVGRVASAARDAASAALNAARDFLGISSPSKVFRLQVGRQIGAGLVQGIDDSQPGVRSSMDRLTSMRPPDPVSTASVRGAAAATSGDAGPDEARRSPVNLYTPDIPAALRALQEFTRRENALRFVEG